MTEHEHHSASEEALRSAPGRKWRPDEDSRQDALQRYLGAVAAVAAAAEEPSPLETPHTQDRPEPVPTVRPEPARPTAAQVREVMDVPAASVPGSMPFLEIARMLSHEHVSSLPVVDDDDRVVGVVSESDLLAKAAVAAVAPRPGPIGRLRERRLYEKAQGETASTLMTSPATSVYPSTPIAGAAWLAAHARLKRLPVTDHRGRLVGVVRRSSLLQALVRDDDKILEEIESRIIEHEFQLDPGTLEVHVDHGVVKIEGRVEQARIPQLLEEIGEIDDVTDVVDHLTAV